MLTVTCGQGLIPLEPTRGAAQTSQPLCVLEEKRLIVSAQPSDAFLIQEMLPLPARAAAAV